MGSFAGQKERIRIDFPRNALETTKEVVQKSAASGLRGTRGQETDYWPGKTEHVDESVTTTVRGATIDFLAAIVRYRFPRTKLNNGNVSLI